MAIRYSLPHLPMLDSNGDPVSGSKANFYESGTTTRLDTYSDEDLTSANANPVVADAAGRWADIWLKSQAYKVVITDSLDAVIETEDPVNGNLVVSGDDFKPTAQASPNMTVLVAAGALYDMASKVLIAKTAQTSAGITAPSSNPRKDIIHINQFTGVIGVTTGSEGAIPVDPTLAINLLPIARVTLATTTTEITNSLITDIRELGLLGESLGWLLLATAEASDDALIDLTWTDGNFRMIVVAFDSIVSATDDVDLYLRTSIDGGSSFQSSYDYQLEHNEGATVNSEAATGAAQILMTETTAGKGLGNTANDFYTGTLEIINPETQKFKTIRFSAVQTQADAALVTVRGGGHANVTGTSDLDGLRFLASAGNITSGEFAVWGVR